MMIKHIDMKLSTMKKIMIPSQRLIWEKAIQLNLAGRTWDIGWIGKTFLQIKEN